MNAERNRKVLVAMLVLVMALRLLVGCSGNDMRLAMDFEDVSQVDDFRCYAYIGSEETPICIEGDVARQMYASLATAAENAEYTNGISVKSSVNPSEDVIHLSFQSGGDGYFGIQMPGTDTSDATITLRDCVFYGFFIILADDQTTWHQSPIHSHVETYQFPDGTYDNVMKHINNN